MNRSKSTPDLRQNSACDEPGMPEDIKAAFGTLGFAKSASFLSTQHVHKLWGSLKSFLAGAEAGRNGRQIISRFGGSNQGWKINNFWESSADFNAIARHPAILSEVAHITGAKKIRLWRDQLLVKPPGAESDVKWHQDAYWWSVLSPANQVTAWIALDPVTVTNGCLSMVAGSHKWGLQTSLIDIMNSTNTIPVHHDMPIKLHDIEMSIGSIHYHHCLTWHASHPNFSTGMRRAYAIHYLIDDTYLVPSKAHPIRDSITVDEHGRVSGDGFPTLWPLDPPQ